MNRKILIPRIFLSKMTIIRKILRIRLILRIGIFVNTDPGPDIICTHVVQVFIHVYLSCLFLFAIAPNEMN